MTELQCILATAYIAFCLFVIGPSFSGVLSLRASFVYPCVIVIPPSPYLVLLQRFQLPVVVDSNCPAPCLRHYLILFTFPNFSITSSLYLGCYVICKCFRFLSRVREFYAKPFIAGGFSLTCFCIYHHLVSCI